MTFCFCRRNHKVNAVVFVNEQLPVRKMPMIVFSHGLLSAAGWFDYLVEDVTDLGMIWVGLADYEGVGSLILIWFWLW
jgi:hypothetical protein